MIAKLVELARVATAIAKLMSDQKRDRPTAGEWKQLVRAMHDVLDAA